MRGNLDRSGPPERRSRQYAQALRDLGIQLTSIIRDYMEPCLKDLPLFEGMENGSEQVEKRIGVLYRFSQRALDDESEGYMGRGRRLFMRVMEIALGDDGGMDEGSEPMGEAEEIGEDRGANGGQTGGKTGRQYLFDIDDRRECRWRRRTRKD